MTDPVHLNRILQSLDDRFLTDHLLKNLRPEFSRNDLVLAHEGEDSNNETGSGDTASHWFTQYRCFLPDLAGFSGSNCAAPLNLMEAAFSFSGESGIRTHGGVTPTHAFQACSLNHSDISPDGSHFLTFNFPTVPHVSTAERSRSVRLRHRPKPAGDRSPAFRYQFGKSAAG